MLIVLIVLVIVNTFVGGICLLRYLDHGDGRALFWGLVNLFGVVINAVNIAAYI